MKMKVAAMLMALTGVAFQFTNCARFLGDLVGDRIWLSVVD